MFDSKKRSHEENYKYASKQEIDNQLKIMKCPKSEKVPPIAEEPDFKKIKKEEDNAADQNDLDIYNNPKYNFFPEYEMNLPIYSKKNEVFYLLI